MFDEEKYIEGYIFDLDGVVVDTAEFHFTAWKRLANELGIPFTKEDNEKLKGVSRIRSLEILLSLGSAKYDEGTIKELADRKNDWYLELISTMNQDDILPGVLALLNELKKRNLKLALGSASKNARTIIRKVNLENYFDVIIDGTQVTRAKPDPEVFTKCAAGLRVDPKDCVVFEDAEAGIEAAKRAGMYTIGIGSPHELGNANIVIESFQRLDMGLSNFGLPLSNGAR